MDGKNINFLNKKKKKESTHSYTISLRKETLSNIVKFACIIIMYIMLACWWYKKLEYIFPVRRIMKTSSKIVVGGCAQNMKKKKQRKS